MKTVAKSPPVFCMQHFLSSSYIDKFIFLEKLLFTVMAPLFENFTPITLQNVGNSDLEKFRSGREVFARYRSSKIDKT
jgi:hypothetical protein